MATPANCKTWAYDNIAYIHMELSSRCNAACPGCSRFVMNSPVVKPELVQTDVTIEQFKKWFDLKFIRQIKKWQFCGSYGDPLACKDLYQILEYICENSRASIQINTNGGLGNKDLYTKIGTLFTKYPSYEFYRYITFSVDGLDDTNHIYRRNVIWDKLWENMMAYIDTGADAHWDYLQFKHNVHQVHEAKAIADNYGIIFHLKNPFSTPKTATPVYSKELKLDYIIEDAFDNGYEPYEPVGTGYVAPMPDKITEEGIIQCNSMKDDGKTEIYIDSQGNVLPCCFVGYATMNSFIGHAVQAQKVLSDLGAKNNLDNFTLKEILINGALNVWSNSWEEKTINICWSSCGKNTSKQTNVEGLFVKK